MFSGYTDEQWREVERIDTALSILSNVLWIIAGLAALHVWKRGRSTG